MCRCVGGCWREVCAGGGGRGEGGTVRGKGGMGVQLAQFGWLVSVGAGVGGDAESKVSHCSD